MFLDVEEMYDDVARGPLVGMSSTDCKQYSFYTGL
jgi:hypothetical protein